MSLSNPNTDYRSNLTRSKFINKTSKKKTFEKWTFEQETYEKHPCKNLKDLKFKYENSVH